MDLLADVGERGPGAGVRARHAAIADRRQQHGHHGDEDGGDDVALAAFVQHAEDGHRRHRLDDDDAVEDQVPQRQRALEALGRGVAGGHGRGLRGCHGPSYTPKPLVVFSAN